MAHRCGHCGDLSVSAGGFSLPFPCREVALGGGCRGAVLAEGRGEGLGGSEWLGGRCPAAEQGPGSAAGAAPSCRLAPSLPSSFVPTAKPGAGSP